MYSTPLRSALVAFVATASAVAAAPSLSLKVTGPGAVDGVENLKVVTTLTNTGDETLKLLNDPNCVLNSLPADTFAITTDSGASPSFTGVRVKYSPSQAAKSTDSSAITVLAPGATVSITHDSTSLSVVFAVSSAYRNFTNAGYTQYSVATSTTFYAVDANNQVSTLTAGNLVVVRHPGLLRKRAPNLDVDGCSDEQQTALTAAALATYDYATTAWSYLDSFNEDLRRGTTLGSARTTLRGTRRCSLLSLSHFRNTIAGNGFTGLTYDCHTCTDTEVYAYYVYPDEFGTVYLCGAFWSSAPAVGSLGL